MPGGMYWHHWDTITTGGDMQKTRLNIYLNPQQKEKLQKLHAKTGAPVSELVRRAIEMYLKKEG